MWLFYLSPSCTMNWIAMNCNYWNGNKSKGPSQFKVLLLLHRPHFVAHLLSDPGTIIRSESLSILSYTVSVTVKVLSLSFFAASFASQLWQSSLRRSSSISFFSSVTTMSASLSSNCLRSSATKPWTLAKGIHSGSILTSPTNLSWPCRVSSQSKCTTKTQHIKRSRWSLLFKERLTNYEY